MDTWEYRTFKLTVEAAADPATYDMLGNEGWELRGLAPLRKVYARSGGDPGRQDAGAPGNGAPHLPVRCPERSGQQVCFQSVLAARDAQLVQG